MSDEPTIHVDRREETGFPPAQHEAAKGLVLCVRHANQRARDLPFAGECAPSATWRGGRGQVVTCAVPEALQEGQ